jgi:hypothetical protein
VDGTLYGCNHWSVISIVLSTVREAWLTGGIKKLWAESGGRVVVVDASSIGIGKAKGTG